MIQNTMVLPEPCLIFVYLYNLTESIIDNWRELFLQTA